MAIQSTESTAVDRAALLARYRRNRDRSRRLFDLLTEDAYYSQPIALRHPIVFYEGHLPAFSFNTLVKKALGSPSIDPSLETLFARGIDPHDSRAGHAASNQSRWPDRTVVQQFGAEADRQVVDALANVDIERPGHPLLDRAEAVFTILEHEVMHQETLLYMWHRLPLEQKLVPAGYVPLVDGKEPGAEWMDVSPGRVTLGVDRSAIPFGWDNEFPACAAHVEAAAIERHNVTNLRYLEFVEAGGYEDERWWPPESWRWLRASRIGHPLFWERRGGAWFWRGMFDVIPLPLAWPVYVSQAEASAYARWRGVRLPTEAEFQRAAFGTPDGEERTHPWGEAEPTDVHGVFDFASWDPQPAGCHPRGRSAWGVDDLVGNGWEWTSTVFGPFPGFRPMASYPEYSADFFDGDHFVIKGASPATAGELLRPTFRNWFRARYPYVYAAFRCVKDGEQPAMTVRPAVPSGRTGPGGSARATFALDVQYYLSQDPRQLPSRYLYDALGSCLFEAICRLPWYPIMRAEARLLTAHRHEIFAAAGPVTRIVELGCGSGEKVATLASGRDLAAGPLEVHLIDVSATALALSTRTLSLLEGVRVVPHETPYEVGLTELGSARQTPGRTLGLFLGSNIGNFDPPGADEFLHEIRTALRPGDFLLLGADLVKPERVLQLAYDDPLGVTAAFNRNLLVQINRELGGDFDLESFVHRALWKAAESRVEMHLTSLRRQVVRVAAAELELTLDEGESIWTESSYKYEPATVALAIERAGFEPVSQWIDADDRFALTLARAV